MRWKDKRISLLIVVTVFLACYWLPVGHPRFDGALVEALHLVKWYAREHVILCLVPAFFIAGAIATFVSQAAVMRYLGARANKVLAYGVASVSGTILTVCSCTVLPLFAGIYRRGAGLGPATAFLYSGPAINVLAIVLTARVLGAGLGIARAVGAVVFSIVIGLLMQAIFRNRVEDAPAVLPDADARPARSLGQEAFYFATLVGILVFANWAPPAEAHGFWAAVYDVRWFVTAAFGVALAIVLPGWFGARRVDVVVAVAGVALLAWWFPRLPQVPFVAGVVAVTLLARRAGGELEAWLVSTWDFAKQILPLLLLGVLVAGLLLGRPGHEGWIPERWVSAAVGGNSLGANLFASVAGAFMYFATLTEVPILQGLLGNGMGQGPALALLLAGPALSLPNMLVIRSVMGTRKTVVYVALVIVMATASGLAYGALAG